MWHGQDGILVLVVCPAACGEASGGCSLFMLMCWCCACLASAGSVAELCKDPAAQEWILAELNSVGKDNKVVVMP